MIVNPPLKWHGGKHDLAKWIISLMPERCKNPNAPDASDPGWLHYVEPYFGGGSVLLANDPEGISEVANDINGPLSNFWKVLQDHEQFEVFQRDIEAVPFSRIEFEEADEFNPKPFATADRIESAVAFFIRCRQSLAGRMDSFTPLSKNRTRRGMNEQASAWLNCIEGLPAVHARLKRVVILNDDALNVIRQQDGPRTLFYLDPPYLHETRTSTGEYQHEMTYGDHQKLLQTLWNIEGQFLLSGYRSKLYDDCAVGYGWQRHEKKINNHAAGGKKKRTMTECVWTNYQTSNKDQGLLGD